MDLQFETRAGVEILKLPQRVTANEVDALRDAFVDRVSLDRTRFVFDLLETPFMDSAALGETVACVKRARAVGGDVRLVVAPRSAVSRIIALTSLDRVLAVFDDVERAITSFADD